MEQRYINSMDMYEEEIDLKELIVALLRKWRVVITTAIVFAFLFGGGKGTIEFMKLRDPEYVREQTESIEKEKTQYDTQMEMYETQLKNLESEVLAMNEYREKSFYMNIDPYNEYRETVTYYINTDYQIMPGMDYQNINQATSILNAYVRQVQDFDVFGQAVNLIGKEINIGDLRELVQVQQDNANYMFTVTIVGENDEIPSVLMDVIRDTVKNSKKEIETVIGKHSIEEVAFTSGYVVDTVLSDTRVRFQDNLTKLHDAISKKQKAIDDLKEPSGEIPSKNNVLKQMVKYALIGGFCGGLFAILYIGVLFVIGDRMPNDTNLKEKYNIHIIGNYREKRDNKVLSFIDSCIDRIEGIKNSEYDETKAFCLAAANLDSRIKDNMKVLLVGTLRKDKLQRVFTNLSEFAEQKNYTLIEGGDLTEEPSAVRRLTEVDAVVFSESREKTKRSQFLKNLNLVKIQEKDIIGIFFIDNF